MRTHVVFIALSASMTAWAQTPPILLEACNAMEPAARRLECLRAASGMSAAGATAPSSRPTAAPQAFYGPSNTAPRAAVAPSGSYSAGDKTCYVGPRGGTYTITASGRKNYSGC